MASLKLIYQNYLSNPTANLLSENASLNYITTLTTINTAAAIVKHHVAHQKVLKKKEEKVLSCIEGDNAICMDVETTLEFLTGGGAYLPGLDDNFLADRVVTFPVVSIRSEPVGKAFLLIISRCTSFISTPARKSNKSAFIGTKGLYSNSWT